MSLALRFTKKFPEVSSDSLRRQAKSKVLESSKPHLYRRETGSVFRSARGERRGRVFHILLLLEAWSQTCTRPDIVYAVGLLGRYQIHPGMEHWKAAFKVMRYPQGSETKWSHKGDPGIVRYSDSYYAGYPDTRKSTSGYVFLLAGSAISWKSEKESQPLPLHTLSILLRGHMPGQAEEIHHRTSGDGYYL